LGKYLGKPKAPTLPLITLRLFPTKIRLPIWHPSDDGDDRSWHMNNTKLRCRYIR